MDQDLSHHTCILEVSEGHDRTISASGIILSPEEGVILSHISLITPLLLPDQLLDLKHQEHLTYNQTKHFNIKVITEKNDQGDKPELSTRNNSSYSPSQIDRSTVPFNQKTLDKESSSEPRYTVRTGEILLTWKSERLSRTLQKLMPKTDGWTFAHPDKSKENETDSEIEKVFDCLPYFLVIKTGDALPVPKDPLDILSPMCLRLGERVNVAGTPFGTLCPPVFINSLSQGVISNFSGHQRELMLTDARAIPGTEGGLVFVKNPEHEKIAAVGMLIAPLCWKSCEWVGLSLACSLHEVLRSLTSLDLDHLPPELRYSLLRTSSYLTISHLTSRLKDVQERSGPRSNDTVLVRSGNNWGTGFIIERHIGLILTCSHVVRNNNIVIVVQTYPERHSVDARVIYSTPAGQVFDVAILRVINSKSSLLTKGAERRLPYLKPSEGEVVYAVGHACFEEKHNLRASVTGGVVSKVVYSRKIPVMIQTSCAVHSGASGGPLMTEEGHVVGMLTCNAKDTVSGASFPHISMSVPMVTIWPIIQQYIKTQDKRVLEKLHVKDRPTKALWDLQESVSSIKSRL